MSSRPHKRPAAAAWESFSRKHSLSGYQTAVILGSGLGADMHSARSIPYGRIPGLPPSGVEGHEGILEAGTMGSAPILLFKGRAHLYEGYSPAEVTAVVRFVHSLGIRKIILTNAAGGIHRRFRPGDIMFVMDHLNLTGRTPLSGPQFLDLSSVYSAGLMREARAAGRRAGISVHGGVLASVPGPSYETPAEIRMLRRAGADAVCMSTVLEAIEAKSLGLSVVALSYITNAAAGIHTGTLSHADVLRSAFRGRRAFASFLSLFVPIFAGSRVSPAPGRSTGMS